MDDYLNDLATKKFGRLTIVKFSHKVKYTPMLQCICDCGNTTVVSKYAITHGLVRSCGCLKRETVGKNGFKFKHGVCSKPNYSPEYRTWIRMRERCNNKNKECYKDYGGRGIVVCERWNDFTLFLKDMGKKPSPKHTLDRFPNNNGNYEPDNCRWATWKEQQNNRRNTKWVEFNNIKIPFTVFVSTIGQTRNVIRYHLKSGKTYMELVIKYNKEHLFL
jgi:hypothetical protein